MWEYLKNNFRIKVAVISATMMIFIFISSGIFVFGSEIPEVRTIEIPLTATIGNDIAVLDISCTDQGYIAAKYSGDNEKVKISVSKNDDKNIYDLLPDQRDDYIVLPLHAGGGVYEVFFYENLEETYYLITFAASFETNIEDKFLPYLYPSSLVSFTPGSKAVRATQSIIRVSGSDTEIIENTLKYLSVKLNYDDKLSNELYKTNMTYIPDIDEVLSEGKGACLDYATIMAAMLRITGIPAQVVIGDLMMQDREIQRHSWVRAFMRDLGAWIDIDPTYGISASRNSGLMNPYALYSVEYYY